MSERIPGMWLLPLLLLAALVAAGARPPAKAAGEGPAGAPATKPEGPASPALQVLSEFAGGAADPLKALTQGPDRWSVEPIVVMVPDPLDSRFDYMYDRFLVAIQRAVEDRGFLMERYSLPWRRDGREGEEEQDAGKEEPARRGEPGAILFRHGSGIEKKLILALLVGETPTSGLHQAAFRRALKLFHLLDRERILIAGPTFSGSSHTMVRVLESLCPSQRKRLSIRIVSGSATAIDPGYFRDTVHLGFATTQVPDATMEEAAIDLLTGAPFWARCEEIAFLKEGSTLFGRRGGSIPRLCAGRAPLEFNFPLHISELRQGDEAPERRDRTTPIDEERKDRSRLPLRAPPGAIDVPPVLSELEAASAELSLSHLVGVISSRGIRYVGILASDLRDTIFLAREVRQRCPLALLFTFDLDLAYLHSSVNRVFRGSLVFTPYPSFAPGGLGWSDDRTEARAGLFGSQAPRGLYEAITSLLGPESDPPERPVWVVAAGRDGFWPLRRLSGPADNPLWMWRRAIEGGSCGWSTIVLLIGVALCCWIPARDLRRNLAAGAPRRRGSGAFVALCADLFDDAYFEAFRQPRRAYLLSMCLLLIILALIGSSIALLPFARGGWLPSLLAEFGDSFGVGSRLLVLLLVALFLLAALGGAVAAARRILGLTWKESGGGGVARSEVLVGGLCVILGLTGWLAGSWLFGGTAEESLFLFLRATRPGGGLSPLLPLLFLSLGGILFIASTLYRLRRLERHRNSRPMLAWREGPLPGLAMMEIEIREVASCSPMRLRRFWLVFGLVVLSGLPMFLSGDELSMERAAFDWLFQASYVGLYITFVVAAWRFALVRGRMRWLLGHLITHPLSVRFAELRRGLARGERFDRWGREDSVRALQRSVDLAAAITGAEIPDLRQRIARARGSIEETRGHLARRDYRSFCLQRLRAQEEITDAAEAVASALETLPGPDPAAGPPDPEGELDPSPRAAAERFLASRVLELLQEVQYQLRNLATCVTAGLLLLLLAVASYPFVSRESYLVYNWIAVICISGSLQIGFMQMNRDPILSALSGTTPGRLTWDLSLVGQTLKYGLLPLIGLLGAQYPSAVERLIPWIQSVFGAQP